MSNSYTTCQEWRIADINRDGTSGTVDLWPKYVLHCDDTDKSPYMYYFAYDEDETYEYSPLRTVLNNYIYNGFTSDVQNAMKTQSFVSDGSNRTLYDKVKCPSVNELGYGNSSAKYPLFNDMSGGTGSSITLYTTFGTTGNIYENRPISYWTRTLSSAHYVWNVVWHGSGAISVFSPYYVGSKSAVAAIIRF